MERVVRILEKVDGKGGVPTVGTPIAATAAEWCLRVAASSASHRSGVWVEGGYASGRASSPATELALTFWIRMAAGTSAGYSDGYRCGRTTTPTAPDLTPYTVTDSALFFCFVCHSGAAAGRRCLTRGCPPTMRGRGRQFSARRLFYTPSTTPHALRREAPLARSCRHNSPPPFGIMQPQAKHKFSGRRPPHSVLIRLCRFSTGTWPLLASGLCVSDFEMGCRLSFPPSPRSWGPLCRLYFLSLMVTCVCREFFNFVGASRARRVDSPQSSRHYCRASLI